MLMNLGTRELHTSNLILCGPKPGLNLKLVIFVSFIDKIDYDSMSQCKGEKNMSLPNGNSKDSSLSLFQKTSIAFHHFCSTSTLVGKVLIVDQHTMHNFIPANNLCLWTGFSAISILEILYYLYVSSTKSIFGQL